MKRSALQLNSAVLVRMVPLALAYLLFLSSERMRRQSIDSNSDFLSQYRWFVEIDVGENVSGNGSDIGNGERQYMLFVVWIVRGVDVVLE